MNDIIEVISKIKLNKKFKNANLVEKSFIQWSCNFLIDYNIEKYSEKLFQYFRLIESIDFQEIEEANQHKKAMRMIKLFDKLQLTCSKEELKIFTIDELKPTYYHIHPFIYGLMLHFYDLRFSEEIDFKITLLTQWIEEIAYTVDDFYQNELKKNTSKRKNQEIEFQGQ